MTKIVVVGGSGFLGARAVAGLRAAGLDVAVASRRAPVQVDVTRPDTFEALAPFDVVLDVSDTVSRPPDALIGWCLSRAKTVLEATSEAPCIERLHRAFAGTSGRLVLGGGIFTGVSNLLAREVAKEVGGAAALTLGVASSPFSGAGAGTIALMLRAMTLPIVRWQAGQRVEEQAMRRGPVLDFGGVTRATGYMSLAEPFMLHETTGAPSVDVVFAPKPGFLVPAFMGMPPWLVRQGWFQAVMRAYFTVLRRALLAKVSTSVELVAEARAGDRHARRWVHARDGMQAGGLALAAMTEAVLRDPGWRGVRFIDDVCALAPTVARVNELAGAEVLRLALDRRAAAREKARR